MYPPEDRIKVLSDSALNLTTVATEVSFGCHEANLKIYLDTRNLHATLVCCDDFHQNVCSEDYTLLNGVNEFVPILPAFFSVF
jgi:hypothetical protein